MTDAPTGRAGRPRRRTRGPAGPLRAGLTLIEMLVAASLGVLIVSLAASLFVGQLRAYLRVQGIAAVQRDLRLGIALLPMDLRGASRADGDFLALTDTMVELRATIASSVICQTIGAGKTTFVLPPPNQPPVTFTSLVTWPLKGDTVKVLIRTAAGGDGDRWLTAAVGEGGLVSAPTSTAGRLCSWATPKNPRLSLPLVWAGAPTGPTSTQLDLVQPNMPVRVLRRVRYALYKANSGRWYLGYSERQPDGSWGPRSPVAGPYDAATSPTRAGIRFAYFDTLGAPLAAPASPTSVGRIDITIRPRAQVRAGRDSVVVRDSALVRVALRNRF